MKDIELLEIQPLFSGVITTAEKYDTDTTFGDSAIIDAKKIDTLSEYQTVTAIGNFVTAVKVGDLVKINPTAYQDKKYKNTIKEDMVETYTPTVNYNFNIIEVNSAPMLYIQDRDIELIVLKHKEKEIVKSKSKIITEKDLKKPLIIKA